jgi:hypothetical protein
MKRPTLITVVIILQFFLGLLLAGLTVYVLMQARSLEALAEPDSAEAIHGLLVGAAVFGVPALVTLLAVFGLWKPRFWGWVLSFASDVGVLCVLVYSMIDDRDLDSSESALAAVVVVPLVLLLLPGVRKFFWDPGGAELPKRPVDAKNLSS